MGPLRECLTDAGFENVATYIANGNAIVRSALSRAETIARVSRICTDEFNFTKPVFAITLPEWKKLIANNPFPRFKEGAHLHAAVLIKRPTADAIASIKRLLRKGEGFEVIGKVAYLHTPFGFGTSDMAKKFDKLLGVTNTARNWNTVLKLAELAKRVGRPG